MKTLAFDGCVGWLHPAAGRRGVVLCGPYGHELTNCYRLWRGLACRLAAAGMPVLRFDYHGTGDSAGCDTDPGRVPAWLDSVRAAARTLREQTGVEELAFVGLRLGSLLAAAVAQEETSVDALAMIMPVVSGRLFARQLKALSLVKHTFVATRPPRPEWKDDVEAAGYVVTPQTRAELESLDLFQAARAPARRVLLLSRPDGAPNGRLAAKLRELGADVTEGGLAYSVLIPDAPHLAKPADELYAMLAEWLGKGMTIGERAPEPTAPAARIQLPDAEESAQSFGPDGKLFGILCESRSPIGRQPPTLVFVTSGANHHIGINRLWVTMARRMAAHGVSSLRMDIAGIGDSACLPGQRDNETYSTASVADVQAALDLLESRGHREFRLVGLCAGAFLAFHAALRDPRVSELLLLNMGTFVKPAAILPAAEKSGHRSLQFYWRAVLFGETWRRLFTGHFHLCRVARNLLLRAMRQCAGRLAECCGRPSPKTQVLRWFRQLADRRVKTTLVSALEDEGLPVLEEALGRNAGLVRHLGVRMEVLEGADHNLSQRWIADRLEELLCGDAARPMGAELRNHFVTTPSAMDVRECSPSPAPQ